MIRTVVGAIVTLCLLAEPIIAQPHAGQKRDLAPFFQLIDANRISDAGDWLNKQEGLSGKTEFPVRLCRAILSFKQYQYREAFDSFRVPGVRPVPPLPGIILADYQYYLGLTLSEGFELHDLAMTRLDSASRIALIEGDSLRYARIFIAKAQVAFWMQNIDDMLLLTSQAVRYSRQSEIEIEAFNLLGIYYALTGKTEHARRHFNEAIRLSLKSGDSFREQKCRNNYGAFLWSLDKVEDARTIFRRVAGSEKINRVEAAYAHLNLGELSAITGDFENAAKSYKRALDLRLSVYGENSGKVADVYMHMAELARQEKKLTRALEYYRLAADRQGSRLNKTTLHIPDESLYYIRAGEALALKELSDNSPADPELLTQALQSLLASNALYERLDAQLTFDNSRLLLKEKYHVLLERTIDCYFRLQESGRLAGHESQVLKFMDAYKQRLLTEHFERSVLLTEKGKSLANTHEILRRERLYTQLLVSGIEGSGQQSELTKLVYRTDSVSKELYRQHPELKPDTSASADLSMLRRSIQKSKVVLLEYFWGVDNLYSLTISSDKFRLSKVPTSQVKDGLAQFNTIVTHPGDTRAYTEEVESFKRHGYALYQQLIQETDVITGAATLVIVPDGDLLTVPFAALPVAHTGATFKELSYLVTSTNIGYAFSIGSWLQVQQATSDNPPVIIPLPTGDRQLPLDAATLQRTQGGDIMLSNSSSYPLLRSGIDTQVLHVGLHGYANIDNHLLSYLTSEDSVSSKVYAHEIANATYKVDLLVLASCESGIGTIRKSEGAFSLARSFSIAGCTNIVFTLSKVPDAATQRLLQLFYDNLDGPGSENLATQLAGAQRTYLQQSDRFTSHPYYWASLVVMEKEQPEAAPPVILFYLAIVTCAIVLVWIAWRRLR